MSVLENIKETILASDTIAILTHENPDGDAIASSLAFMHALKKLNKNVDVIIPSPNSLFSFLPGFDEIKTEATIAEYDLCIALDSSDLERLHICRDIFTKAKNTIVVDHHITNQNFGDVNYVNAVASSTCQNLVVVIGYLEIGIDIDIATCLYSGILTDTGAFRYNVQPETFEIAAMLLEIGVDISKIYKTLFDTTTESRIKLLSKALDRLELCEDNKIAFTYITMEDEKEVGATEGDHESIVNYGRNIENVDVSILIRAIDNQNKVSLRSNELVDVSLIAIKYGGGGHVKAAGFTTDMSIEQIKQSLINDISKQLVVEK